MILPGCVALLTVWIVLHSFRKLRRVGMASILTVAEALGMSVVGAPDALRRPEAEPAGEPSVASPP